MANRGEMSIRTETSLASLRNASAARDLEEKKKAEKKKACLALILRHLCDHGYTESVDRLQTESGVSLNKFDVADNIDLMQIVQEFEDYYEMRFSRKPRLLKKVTSSDGPTEYGGMKTRPQSNPSRAPLSRMNSGESASRGTPSGRRLSSGADVGTPKKGGSGAPSATSAAPPTDQCAEQGPGGIGVSGTAVKKKGQDAAANGNGSSKSEYGLGSSASDFYDHRLLKPLSMFTDNAELRELAAMITRDIYQENPNVKWDDIAELHGTKKLIKEAVVLPMRYPQFFTGLLSPWKGILLFGPPGTGKTMLAKAVATECHTTFFNISASSIISKWRGDSEKLVRVLFELARYHAPSTIFLDEIDALMSQRGVEGGGGEHEASRRMKTELLIQMDGLAKTNDLVFVLAASNLPWDLDQAMLRRLEKRILVPLPDVKARRQIFEQHLNEFERGQPIDYQWVADQTEGFSGADCTLVCKEAAMRPLRRMMEKIEDENSANSDLKRLPTLGSILKDDLEAALMCTKPSTSKYLRRYEQWQQEFGSST